MISIHKWLSILACLMYSFVGSGQKPAFLIDHNIKWVDSVFTSLTLEEKIGQLLMPRGNYSGKPHDLATLELWVKEYKIGGIVFFASNPTTQAQITNRLQKLSKTPLMIGQDFEWGLGMRLDSTDRFPYAVTLGAVQGRDDLLEAMGVEVARQCKRIGVHINYAPVVDVNNNGNNPVINFRSFGGNKEAVANKGLAYMKGMQSQRLFCTAKHFPGHGDTDVDSHHDLPVIKHDISRLKEIELYPFKKLIDGGLSGVMTAHLNIPALDTTSGLASTFSPAIVDKLLRKDLKFEGLTFTDAMEMKGAVKNFPPGEAMVQAILAGNDVLETFIDVPIAFQAIKDAVNSGRISMKILDTKVKKILMAKSWIGLDKYKPIEMKNLVEDLNSIRADVLNHQFAYESITCLKNDKKLLPINDLTQKIAVVSIEGTYESDFLRIVKNYTDVDYYHVPKEANDSLVQSIVEKTAKYDVVLVGVHLINIRASSKYGLTPSNIKHISKLAVQDNVVISLFGNPFILGKIPELAKSHTLLMAYQMTPFTESAAAQAIFGAIPTRGRLPISLDNSFNEGMGIDLLPIQRLAYGVPELVGIDRVMLENRLDSVVNVGFNANAYPGCVLQVTKDNMVIFQKAYGYHKYEDGAFTLENNLDSGTKFTFIDDAMDNTSNLQTTLKKVQPNNNHTKGLVKISDLYDLASITKISGTMLAVMQLMSEEKFDLDARLVDYYPEFKGSNKADLTFRDMLTHRSGLKSWIPFWKDAIDSLGTLQNALLTENVLEKRFVFTYKKPGFFKRLFGKKTTKSIDYTASIKNDPTLWKDVTNKYGLVWKAKTFQKEQSNEYSIQIGDHLWLHRDYPKKIIQQIKESELNTPSNKSNGVKYDYVYSDLHFYLYPEIIRRLTGKTMPFYLQETYKAIGANSISYNPKSSLEKIVPTEYDSLFRDNLIHGRVHDEGAAMMGGISGHAGLFGNANDLSKIMQLYLNNGSYGGKKYIKPSVINECTKYQFPEFQLRRGIGFDKKDFKPNVQNGPSLASESSYGHSGFTGTFTWVDPKYNLTYVFLSNKVYPTRDNKKISELNIRTEIGNQIIKTIIDSQKIKK